VQLNVYGPASTCKTPWCWGPVDRSKVFLNVRAGAAQYSAVYRGLPDKPSAPQIDGELPTPGAAVGIAVITC
jgi:hypothetical protein